MAGHFGGRSGGRESEVVFGDVEEFGGVFCAGFVGYGGADAFVAVEREGGVSDWEWLWEVATVERMVGGSQKCGKNKHLPVQLTLLHPLSLFVCQRQFEEVLCHVADLVGAF